MTINIQDLLRELVSYTDIRTSDISFTAKVSLYTLRETFKTLETSNEPDKQAKMIALFMGATLYAVIHDDVKYGNNLYPKELAQEIFKIEIYNRLWYGDLVTMHNSVPDLIQLGKEALSRLPQSFNAALLKPFYPKFRQNSEKIDQLVKFCLDHKESLEQVTMDMEDSESSDSDVSEKIKASSFQPQTPEPQQPTCSNTSMQVLGGFMAVLGAAAVAIAFVSLNASTFGLVGLIVAGLGVAATLGGLGLFASATNKKCQAPSNVDRNEDIYSSFSI